MADPATLIKAAVEPLVKHVLAGPAGPHAAANRQDAREAYREFLRASSDAMSAMSGLATLRPSVRGIVWNYSPTQRIIAETDRAIRRLMIAWNDVRLAGDPPLVDLADKVVTAYGELAQLLPSGAASKKDRQRREKEYAAALEVAGAAYRVFLIDVRLAMQIDRPVRWWHLRRRWRRWRAARPTAD